MEPIITPKDITTPSDTDPKLIKTEERLRLLVEKAKDETQALSLTNCTIETKFNWQNLLEGTSNSLKITACPFKIYFNGTTFNQKADFNKIEFEEEITFRGATFCQEADFKYTKFNKRASFGASTFKQNVHLKSTKFLEEADFSEATFENFVDFIETKFEHPLHVFFNETNFWQTACFTEVSFNQKIDFSNTSFQTLIFDNITFGKEGNLQFQECPNITKEASVTFKNINCDSDKVHIKIRRIPKEALITFNFEECHFYGKNVAFNTVHLPHVHITGGNNASGMAADHCYDVENTITPPPQVGFKY